jgi:trk system potassium uptake protein TrkH
LLPRLWPAVLSLGWLLLAIAAAEAVMAAFSFLIDDGEFYAFSIAAGATAIVAGGCILSTSGRRFELNFRDAIILTASAWIVIPAFAALPFLLPPVDLTPVDAYFEMVSGVTTTGSTVMTGLDTQPASLLLWRSTVQWMGGLGIIALALIILPFLNIGGMQLFRLESSDRSEKTFPRVRTVATAVAEVYVLLTALCGLIYWLLGMSPFDAVNHAMSTLATAGYSTHDASFGYFDNPALLWAGTIFMACGAIPFLAYLRFVRGGFRREWVEPQVRAFLITLVACIAVVSIWVMAAGHHIGFDAVTHAAFNVTSVVTTTGFASTDYMQWGSFAAGAFFLLLFVGGCSGSTAGGVKIFRYQMMFGMVGQHVRHAIFPHSVHHIRYGARVVSGEEAASVGAFFIVFMAVFAVFSIALAATGLDTATAMSAAATAIGNVGPGIGPIIGPAGNFAPLTDLQKLLLCGAMIMGRLELFGVLVLFLPSFYR